MGLFKKIRKKVFNDPAEKLKAALKSSGTIEEKAEAWKNAFKESDKALNQVSGKTAIVIGGVLTGAAIVSAAGAGGIGIASGGAGALSSGLDKVAQKGKEVFDVVQNVSDKATKTDEKKAPDETQLMMYAAVAVGIVLLISIIKK